MLSEYEKQVKGWLDSQYLDGYYSSHKAAIIASCEPFGLFADYIDGTGNTYTYLNGKLAGVDKGYTKI